MFKKINEMYQCSQFVVDRMLDKNYKQMEAKDNKSKAKVPDNIIYGWIQEYCSQNNISEKGKITIADKVGYSVNLIKSTAALDQFIEDLM